QHDVSHHARGRVVANVGELLHANVADVSTECAEGKRETLGDPARVLAGAVQGDVGRDARGFDLVGTGAGAGKDVSDRRHDVLPRTEKLKDFAFVGQHRRIHDRTG